NTLKYTKEFSSKFGLFYGELSQILEGFCGYCDCGVLLNVADRIDPSQVIGKETFVSPKAYALEHGLYCRPGVTGWVPCQKDDPLAQPDLNRAAIELAKSGQFGPQPGSGRHLR